MAFTWDAASARYRDADTNRLVKASKINALATASIEETNTVIADLVSSSAESFAKNLRIEIKAESIRQYLLGRGGKKQMAQSDWGKLGAIIKDQYKYLAVFVKEYDEYSERERVRRAKMYIASARESFEKGKQVAAQTTGKFTEELWELDPALENCEDCKALAARGWVKIGELGHLPGDGKTVCLVNCGCTIKYR